jgi:hypothetical protein
MQTSHPADANPPGGSFCLEPSSDAASGKLLERKGLNPEGAEEAERGIRGPSASSR